MRKQSAKKILSSNPDDTAFYFNRSYRVSLQPSWIAFASIVVDRVSVKPSNLTALFCFGGIELTK